MTSSSVIHYSGIWLEPRPYAGGEPLTAQHSQSSWTRKIFKRPGPGGAAIWGVRYRPGKWRRLRAQWFYKLLTASLRQISERMRRVANTRLAIEGQRSGVMSELRPIQDSDSENP